MKEYLAIYDCPAFVGNTISQRPTEMTCRFIAQGDEEAMIKAKQKLGTIMKRGSSFSQTTLSELFEIKPLMNTSSDDARKEFIITKYYI